MINGDKIRKIAHETGFSLCGIAPARRLDDQAERLVDWLDKGYDSGLAYMKRNIDKRLDPSTLLEGARSVVVCAATYKNRHWKQATGPNPRISSYALGKDYHVTIKDMLHEVLALIKAEYPKVRGRCFTDSAPVLEKSWAIEAGLGWRGKNSLVLTPGQGSFVFLGEIIIDKKVDGYDRPYAKDGCGSCTICIDACPNSAIRTPYIIDTGICISRITTEKLPEETAANIPNTHGWIFGCDICQSVCPYNARAPRSLIPAFTPLFDPAEGDRRFWETLTEEKFHDIFGTTPLARTGFDRVRARALDFFSQQEDGE